MQKLMKILSKINKKRVQEGIKNAPRTAPNEVQAAFGVLFGLRCGRKRFSTPSNHFDAGIFEGFWRPLWEVFEDILVYFFEIVFMIDFYVLKV